MQSKLFKPFTPDYAEYLRDESRSVGNAKAFLSLRTKRMLSGFYPICMKLMCRLPYKVGEQGLRQRLCRMEGMF